MLKSHELGVTFVSNSFHSLPPHVLFGSKCGWPHHSERPTSIVLRCEVESRTNLGWTISPLNISTFFFLSQNAIFAVDRCQKRRKRNQKSCNNFPKMKRTNLVAHRNTQVVPTAMNPVWKPVGNPDSMSGCWSLEKIIWTASCKYFFRPLALTWNVFMLGAYVERPPMAGVMLCRGVRSNSRADPESWNAHLLG